MAVGDALRQIALQHLAAGGSAEELHDAVSAIQPPESAFARMAKQGLTGIGESPEGTYPMQEGDLKTAASPAAPPAEAPVQVASMAPPAPPLPGMPGAVPAAPPVGGLGHVAMSGMFGPDPGFGAMGARDVAASRAHETAGLAANADYGTALGTEGAGKAEELKIRGEQAEAETPIREQQAADATTHADAVAEIEQAGKQRLQAQMARYQAASDEAAQAQVHNFFDDKTTGASIMAVISQALSGAANGLAGNPGAPTPLDRIIQRDIEMQKMNLDQKNKNADRQGNMLGVLRDELGSEVLAENAMYQASLTKTEAMIKQLAPHYAGGIASAQAQQALAQIQEKKASAQQSAMQEASKVDAMRGESELRLQEGRDASMAASFAAMARAKGKEQQDFRHRGFKGDIPKANEGSAQKLSQGYYGLQSGLFNVENALSDGTLSLDQYNKIVASDPVLADAVHKLGFTRPGQNDEFRKMLAPGFIAGNFDALGQKTRLHNVRKFFADQYRQQSLGLNPYSRDNPNGLVADYDDEVMGPLWRELDTERANQAAVKQ